MNEVRGRTEYVATLDDASGWKRKLPRKLKKRLAKVYAQTKAQLSVPFSFEPNQKPSTLIGTHNINGCLLSFSEPVLKPDGVWFQDVTVLHSPKPVQKLSLLMSDVAAYRRKGESDAV